MSARLPHSRLLAAASPHRPQRGPSVLGGSLPASPSRSVPPPALPRVHRPRSAPGAFSLRPVSRILTLSSPAPASPLPAAPSPRRPAPASCPSLSSLGLRRLTHPAPFLEPHPDSWLLSQRLGSVRPTLARPVPGNREPAPCSLGPGGWDLGVVFPRGLALRGADLMEVGVE